MKIPLPEDGRTEFQQEWNPSVKKTIIAFANGSGGLIFFGVAKDGEVVGSDHDSTEHAVMSFARSGVEPELTGLVRVELRTIDRKPVTVAYVLPGTELPYRLKGKPFDDDAVFIRMGGQTVPAGLDEIFDLIRRGDRRNWEERPAANQSLTFRTATEILSEAGVPFGEETWSQYGLLNQERLYTNLACLLSDQNPHHIRLNFYWADGAFEHSDMEEGSVLRQMLSLRRKLDDLNSPFVEKNTSSQARRETHPWPVGVLHCGLANLIAHRDYESPVDAAINVFQNNISFMTPGGLPPQVTLEEVLLPGWSFCRNQRLAELFARLRWLEKVGSGFPDLFQAYAGFTQQPTVKHVGRSFLIELPRVEFSKTVLSRDDQLLGVLAEHPEGLSRLEIDMRLNLSRSTTLNTLKKLELSGRIVRQGENRDTLYFLKV